MSVINSQTSPIVFAIHTVPDTETGARKYNLGDLDEKSAIKAMMHLQQQSGKEELPHYLQRIVAISAVSRGASGLPVLNSWGLDNKACESEAEMLTQFLAKLTTSTSTALVSWDNTDRDLPVLMYRSVKNRVPAPLLTTGVFTSLKQALCDGQPEAMTSQKNVMDLIGLGCAPVLSQKTIWKYWRKGKTEKIHKSCINRALDSYKIYYHYLLMTGGLSPEQYLDEMECILSITG